jgi:hypothetical protein
MFNSNNQNKVLKWIDGFFSFDTIYENSVIKGDTLNLDMMMNLIFRQGKLIHSVIYKDFNSLHFDNPVKIENIVICNLTVSNDIENDYNFNLFEIKNSYIFSEFHILNSVLENVFVVNILT